MQNKRYISKLFISSLLFVNIVFADNIKFESIGANIGYANMPYDLEGDVNNVNEPKVDLINVELYSTIKNVFENKTLVPSVHYIFSGNDDLNTHALLFGLNKYFLFENFSLYTGVVAGYGTLLWKDDPLKYTTNNNLSSSSLTGGLQSGIELPITKQVSFNINLKYLLHDYTIELKPLPTYTSELTHPSTASISIGLKWFFEDDKNTQPVIEEIIKSDSDDDGIVDDYDKCPNTSKNETVDAYVCPLDSDNDGILDTLDKCPNTSENESVDTYGCPLDSDNDGISDTLDKCPNTTMNEAVDTYGCPLDSDNDGISDTLDKCPNTTINEAVDT